MSPFEIMRGGTKDVTLSLTSSTNYYGFQFEMQLPDGLSIIDTSGVQAASAISGFSVGYKELSNNKYMIVGFDTAGKTIPLGTHEILVFTFQATDNFNGGQIKICNVKFSTDGENDNHKDIDFSDLELEASPSSDFDTSVDQIGVNNDNLPITLFNLSGVKVATAQSLGDINIAPGIYIVRKGDKYSKVVIR